MKLFKALTVLGIALAIAYVFLAVFVSIKGRDLLKDTLQDFGKEVDVKNVSFLFPLGISIDNLSIGDSEFDEINLSLSLSKILTGSVGFNTVEIQNSTIYILKHDQGLDTPFPLIQLQASSQYAPQEPAPKETSPQEPLEAKKPEVTQKKKSANFFIKRLKLKNLRINFNDESGDRGFQGSLYALDADIFNLGYPLRHRTVLRITSAIKIDNVLIEDSVKIKGFIDFRRKSMDAALDIKKIPYNSFSPYYPPFWKPANLGIQKANFSLHADFKAKNNDLTIKGNVALTDYEFKEAEEGKTETTIAKTLFELLKSDRGYPQFDFEIKTKFDKPRFDFSMITAQARSKMKGIAITVGKEVVKDIIGAPVESVKKAVDTSRGAAEKAIDVTGQALSDVLKTPEKAKDIIKETGKVLKSIFAPKERPPESDQNSTQE